MSKEYNLELNPEFKLEQTIGLHLLDELDVIKVQPKQILNLGHHPMLLQPTLTQLFPKADISNHFASNLSSNSHLHELIIYNLLPLTNTENKNELFKKLSKQLANQGLFLFTCLGSNSFSNYNPSLTAQDLNLFYDPLYLTNALSYYFNSPIISSTNLQVTFNNYAEFVRELSYIFNKLSLSECQKLTNTNNDSNDKNTTISLEVLYVHAWQKSIQPNTFYVNPN